MTTRFEGGADESLEMRLRDALEGVSTDPATPSARDSVLARIGGRSPARMAGDAFDRSVRGSCMVVAGVFLMLVALSYGLPRADPAGEFNRLEGMDAGGVTINEYFGEYSSEASILATLFAEETLQ